MDKFKIGRSQIALTKYLWLMPNYHYPCKIKVNI